VTTSLYCAASAQTVNLLSITLKIEAGVVGLPFMRAAGAPQLLVRELLSFFADDRRQDGQQLT
jgi:hypothetical protein